MSQSASLQSSVCILPLVCSLQSVFYPWSAVFSLYCTPWSAVFSLYFTPGLQSSVCILPLVYSLQSVFYPWSTVFSLYFTPWSAVFSLYFTPWSAVFSLYFTPGLQSALYTDRHNNIRSCSSVLYLLISNSVC